MFPKCVRVLSRSVPAVVLHNVPMKCSLFPLSSKGLSQRSLIASTQRNAGKASDGGFLTLAYVAKRFEEFDKDQDGFITVGECRAAMERLESEVTDGLVHESIIAWDAPNDGVFDYFEFMDHFLSTTLPEEHGEFSYALERQLNSINVMLNHCIAKGDGPISNSQTRQARAELINTIKHTDLDDDGLISPDELRVALRSMSPDVPATAIESKLDDMFVVADTECNCFIDLYEFSARVVQQGLYS